MGVYSEKQWRKKDGKWVPHDERYPDGTLRPFLPGSHAKVKGKTLKYPKYARGGSVRVVRPPQK